MSLSEQRPALSVISSNTLNQKPQDLTSSFKPTLPNLRSVVSSKAFTQQASVQKPSISNSSKYAKHAEKLKYRLQLAYYKLRTDQVSLPIAEIIKKQEAQLTKQQSQLPRKPSVTPSLTRHVSLLAASTPLNSQQSTSSIKKKVSFKRSATTLELPTTSKFKTKNSSSSNGGGALSRISEIQRPKTLRSLSSPQLSKSDNLVHHRSLKIEDLVHTTNNQNRVDVTPIKGRTDDNGDLIMSSPTKKMYSSTPGSYGAAKSLLQLSLISSN